MNDLSKTPHVDRPPPSTDPPLSSPEALSISSQKRKWYQLWPQSIPGRLLVMFAVGLLMAQSLTGVLYWSDRQLNTTPARVESIGNRIISIATLMRSMPPDQQPLFLTALNDPLLQVDVVSEAPLYLTRSFSQNDEGGARALGRFSTDRPDPRSINSQRLPPKRRPHKAFRQRRLEQFRSYLSTAISDPFFVVMRPTRLVRHQANRTRDKWSETDKLPKTNGGRFSTPPNGIPLLPSRHQMVVVIDQNPQWLVMTLPIGFGSRHHGPRFPALLLVMGFLIWLLSAWATRRITHPLVQFTAAADRLGLDVEAPPLPEQGSRELRQAAQAFNRMQARLQRLISDRTFMLAAISHDLRTILTRLRLRTELMDDPSQQQKVQGDLSQMEIMLNSTLTFAKEDSTPEARTTFDLSSLIQSVCDDLTDSGHRIACDSGDRIILQGQPFALRRAFTNLIENAAIYGHSANVTVTSGTNTKMAGQEEWVEVAIADQGPGIAPEMREQVFKPFFRLERSRNRQTGGTGLGLSVARTVVRRHGGDIILQNYPHPDAINQPDGGLLSTVRLPQNVKV